MFLELIISSFENKTRQKGRRCRLEHASLLFLCPTGCPLPRSSRLDILALTSSLRGLLQNLFDVLFWKECHQARTLGSHQTGGGQKLRPWAGWEGNERGLRYETNKKKFNGNSFVSQHFALNLGFIRRNQQGKIKIKKDRDR